MLRCVNLSSDFQLLPAGLSANCGRYLQSRRIVASGFIFVVGHCQVADSPDASVGVVAGPGGRNIRFVGQTLRQGDVHLGAGRRVRAGVAGGNLDGHPVAGVNGTVFGICVFGGHSDAQVSHQPHVEGVIPHVAGDADIRALRRQAVSPVLVRMALDMHLEFVPAGPGEEPDGVFVFVRGYLHLVAVRIGRIPDGRIRTSRTGGRDSVSERVPPALLSDIKLVDVVELELDLPVARYGSRLGGIAPVLRIQQVGGDTDAQAIVGRVAGGTRRQDPNLPVANTVTGAVVVGIAVFLVVRSPQRRIIGLSIGRVGRAQIDLGAIRDVDDCFIDVDVGRGADIPGRRNVAKAVVLFWNVHHRGRAGVVGQLLLAWVPVHVEQGDVAGIDHLGRAGRAPLGQGEAGC